MTFILGALKIIILLGTLITIHELGHFIAAKSFGVTVLKFAIGFGPVIFKKIFKETEYTIRLIPLGGFVQLEGEEKRTDDINSYSNKPIWQRIIIISAGAIVNIVFALIVYVGICMSNDVYITSKLSNVDKNSTLYEIGFRDDDEIISINGNRTLTKTNVEEMISSSKDDNMNFKIIRDGEKMDLPVTLETTSIGYAGIAFDDDANILYITPGSSAEMVNMQIGDKVLSINEYWNLATDDIIRMIRENPNKELLMVVKRGEEVVEFTMVPNEKICRLFDVTYEVIEPAFFENLYYALDEAGWYFGATIKGLVGIFIGKTENVQVMGPVGIATEISATESVIEFFYMMCAISLSLGIFNLLPIPALDGGKDLLLIIEAIRRKPLKEKTEITVQLVGFGFIILLSVVIMCFDIAKLF